MTSTTRPEPPRVEVGPAPGILVVDDEATLRFTVSESLKDSGYRSFPAANGAEAMAALRENDIDVVLLDMKLKESGEDGMVLLKSLKHDFPELEVVMMTAYGKFEHAVEATKAGCYHFLGKPLHLDQLKMVVKGALENAVLRREVEVVRRGAQGRYPVDDVVGESSAMLAVMDTVKRVARSPSTVLIRGETGTGKEVIARAVHRHSNVAGGPFVPINCSAVPETLLESELFGHEKGAFTDAQSRREGVFELAHQGTLFLDEIGEMAPGLQAKLLRVLETSSFRRLGGTSDLEVRVRVVAATNRNLKQAVADSSFREDLYYRLNVVPIDLPPLRDRPEDIPVLARFFLTLLNRELGREIEGFTPGAEDLLQGYAWPGNVRELRNVVERAILLAPGDLIDTEVLALEAVPSARATAGAELESLAEAERYVIEKALRRFDGNKTRAAEHLKLSRQTLRAKIRQYELEDPEESNGS